MKYPAMYRRRLIPDECILLKDDHILFFDEKHLVTSWNALKPKKALHHGISCIFFEDNIKLSKFYRADNSLIYWYIDIISANIYYGEPDLSLPYRATDAPPFKETSGVLFAEPESGTGYSDLLTPASEGDSGRDRVSLIVTDLLADILIYPDGFVKVVDLGEISDAIDKNLIDGATAAMTLRITDRTLESIYRGDFRKYQDYVETFE